ncbi:hypothetical protein ID866_8446 [Astraeus odoratus]|nr:hypothetical protein ID866_8446 [Astraeus odoratus]
MRAAMFPLASSLSVAVLLAVSIVAGPIEDRTSPISLLFAKYIKSSGTVNLIAHDQTRAADLIERANAIASGKLDRRIASVPVTNEAVSYIAQVGVGSPATTYNLIVDTGSSNTWVGASTPYKPTNTSVDSNEPVSVTYGSGSFSGTEWYDTVTLASDLIIPNQSIAVASTSTGFDGVDGIVGIGPVDLTQGTLTNEPNTYIPTVTDNLYSQGTISEEVIGVSFEPTTSTYVTNGELTFGGVDSTKYTGSINYVSLTTTAPASYYWGINESIAYGGTTILPETAGIVDTGTTLVLIASNAFSSYQSLTGAVMDDNTGLLRITSAQYSSLQNLNFDIGGVTYALTPNGQIWPRALNTYIGGTSSSIYLIVGNLGSSSGQGLDFIDGQAFLERFYSVFDTTSRRFGIATTPYTTASTN